MSGFQGAADLVEQLALKPHPEGGWYREVFRSATRTDTPRGARSALTTIYYLLERLQLSRWHVVEADEIWHFYAGSPLELLEYHPVSRRFARHLLGHVGADDDDESGDSVAAIAGGVWQAARSLGPWSLLGCTVGPGFDFEDFKFVSALPDHVGHFRGELSPYAALL